MLDGIRYFEELTSVVEPTGNFVVSLVQQRDSDSQQDLGQITETERIALRLNLSIPPVLKTPQLYASTLRYFKYTVTLIKQMTNIRSNVYAIGNKKYL